tara:strand:- start:121 stop:282 length:162 start_codon:yes stop_codon:yes gene_type:complete
LKRLKTYTDITHNVFARIAFCSVELAFIFTKADQKKLDASLVVDKITGSVKHN